VCEPEDGTAAWVRERLAARGLVAMLLTTEELCIGSAWEHALSRDGADFEVVIGDGRRLRAQDVAWVLNRLMRIPEGYLDTAQPADVSYVEQEWRALLCSALRCLQSAGVRVVEPPDPYALPGRWRSPLEWELLAARAGLPVQARDLTDAPRAHRTLAWALVVGERVLMDGQVPEELSAPCRRLAGLASVSTLQIVFTCEERGNRPMFCGVLPLADLRLAGEESIDALVALLSS
jgi:hypothetical protein